MKVLIIPGGGVFGIIPSLLLAGMNGSLRRVDVFGGTSIGGILSLMYAYGKHPLEVHSDFRSMMGEVFQRSMWSRIIPGPRYNGEALTQALERLIPGTLGDLHQVVVVPSMDFTASKPKVWSNLDGLDGDAELWRVGRSTSAAPTYFPPQDMSGHALIDGGLLENIPLVTTCTAIRRAKGVPYSDMDVFVVGTGHRNTENPSHAFARVRGWGMLSWARPLASLLTEGNEMGSVFWAHALGLRSFHFFDPITLEDSWGMDDVKAGRLAEERASAHQQEFRDMFIPWLNS